MYQSGLYWQFIGWAQLVAGFLLMTQRLSRLGAIMFLPIISNIFVITLSCYFAFTPVITGLMLLANGLLIAWGWPYFKGLVADSRVYYQKTDYEKARVWEVTGLILFLGTASYRIISDYSNFFYGSGR